jgi:heme/copper-type cytochrome/quinol oxidase subunit 1
LRAYCLSTQIGTPIARLRGGKHGSGHRRHLERPGLGSAHFLSAFDGQPNWLWTTVGVATEILFIVLPASLGWIDTVDVGLTRTLFAWTLHPIVYFWLFPAYIAFYTMTPQAAGGRLYSDTLGRLSFVLLLLYSLPVGMHHVLIDPMQSTGFKFVQMMLTILVSVPTLLTVFTVAASMEIAGRLRGGRGLFGWIPALPWERPMVLATGLSFVMLFFGGGGGLVNLGYDAHPQHVLGDGAFPFDLRRRCRDHVFRHFL